MNDITRSTAIYALLLICLYGLYAAVTRGTANAWYFKAEFAINEWAETGKIKDEQEYIDTLEAIQKAYDFDPTHPHYVHILGRVTHWGVNRYYEPLELLDDVKLRYLEATKLRPLWPDPWVDLARLNNYLNGYDRETQGYMQMALKTGPYLEFVTEGVMKVLLLNYSDLSADDKKLLFKQFSIAVKQPEVLNKVMAFATRIEREKLLCLQLKFNNDYSETKESSVYRRYCPV